MNRFAFTFAAVAALALCVGTASAQGPAYPTYPQPAAPVYVPPAAPVYVQPAAPVVVAPPSIVVSPVFPAYGVGWPYYGYGRPYYPGWRYNHFFRR